MSSVVPAADQAQPCHLFRIPPELRIRIYEYCFTTHRGFLYDEGGPWRMPIGDPGLLTTSLLRTCRQVYNEGHTIFEHEFRHVFITATYEFTAPPAIEPVEHERLRKALPRLPNVTIIASVGTPSSESLGPIINAFNLLRDLDFGRNARQLWIVLNHGTDKKDNDLENLIQIFNIVDCRGTVNIGMRGKPGSASTLTQYSGTKLAELMKRLKAKNIIFE